jgi:outer membrane protein assembly factor BamA
MDLTPGKIFNKRQLNKLIEQLKATYISKGYYGIKITKEVEIDSSNRVGVELDISEGEVALNLNSNINTLFVLRQIALNIGDFKIKITKVEIV